MAHLICKNFTYVIHHQISQEIKGTVCMCEYLLLCTLAQTVLEIILQKVQNF